MTKKNYQTLFLDIGGVLLTNGWDHHMREEGARLFHLDLQEMNRRHAFMFDVYELGKISLDDYLNHVVFYEPRLFTIDEFKAFMFAQSRPYPEMIQFMREIKKRHHLRIVAVNNEGRELMDYRVRQFHLHEFIDFFICSSFVGLRKPDLEIYRLAIDLVQLPPEEIVYLDDRLLLVEIGRELGLQAFQHVSLEQTKQFFTLFHS